MIVKIISIDINIFSLHLQISEISFILLRESLEILCLLYYDIGNWSDSHA